MHSIIMPQAGQTMEDGLVLRWLKQEGEPVEAGEVVLEVETDKAIIEIPSEEAGILRRILATEGAASRRNRRYWDTLARLGSRFPRRRPPRLKSTRLIHIKLLLLKKSGRKSQPQNY